MRVGPRFQMRISSVGRAAGFDPVGPWFESMIRRQFAALAQLAERLPCKQWVEGSIPSGGTKDYAGLAEWPRLWPSKPATSVRPR